jgi:hypothetical protein
MVKPTFGEVVTVIKGLNNNKVLRANRVIVELLKFGREAGLMFIHECIFKTWCSRKVSEN